VTVALAALALAPRPASAVRWGADYFPNVALTNQDGEQVRLWDDLLKDKIVVVELIYTHCQFTCPLETARLAQVQRILGDRVGKDVFFISITLDPRRDTPEVLKAYAEKFHVGPGWQFVTAHPGDVKLVSQKLGLISTSRDPTPINRDGHTPELMIGNVATGVWMRNSALDNAQLLATTIRRFLPHGAAEPRLTRSYAEARELSLSRGEYLFTTRCAVCHAIGRDGLAPDLANVTRTRDPKWLARFIQFPDQVLASGDPIAKRLRAKYRVTMPNLGLGPDDVAAIVEYLASAVKNPATSLVAADAGGKRSGAQELPR
jgi:protein SCO1/2